MEEDSVVHLKWLTFFDFFWGMCIRAHRWRRLCGCESPGNILLQSSKTADIWPVPPGNWNCVLTPVFFFRRINDKLKREIFGSDRPQGGVRMVTGALRQICTSGSWRDAAQLQETGKVTKWEIQATGKSHWDEALGRIFPELPRWKFERWERPLMSQCLLCRTMFNPADLFLQQSTSLCKSSHSGSGCPQLHFWKQGRSFS